jgi:hypothetical protein
MGGTGMNVNFVTFLRAATVEAEMATAATGPNVPEQAEEVAS